MAPQTETNYTLAWIALPFAIIAFSVSMYGVIGNLRHYIKPDYQRYAPTPRQAVVVQVYLPLPLNVYAALLGPAMRCAST